MLRVTKIEKLHQCHCTAPCDVVNIKAPLTVRQKASHLTLEYKAWYTEEFIVD